MRFDLIARGLTWGDLWEFGLIDWVAVVDGLLAEPTSHFRMAMRRMRVAISEADVYLVMHAIGQTNSLMKDDQEKIAFPEHWFISEEERPAYVVTDTDLDEARKLMSM